MCVCVWRGEGLVDKAAWLLDGVLVNWLMKRPGCHNWVYLGITGMEGETVGTVC